MATTRTPPDRTRAPAVRVRERIGSAEVRSRRRRMVALALLAGAAALLVNAIVGENGYFATLHARRTEAQLLHALGHLRTENRALQDERERLESDPATIEHTAREQLGYIRPGEIAVIVKETPAVSPVPPR